MNTLIELFRYSFNGPNANPLPTRIWADDPVDSIPACQQYLGECQMTDIDESIAIFEAVPLPNDQWVEFQMDALNFITDQEAAVLLVMRRRDASNGIALEIDGPLGPSCNYVVFAESLGKQTFFTDGGSDDVTGPINPGSKVRMELKGNQLSLYFDNVLQLAATIPPAIMANLPGGMVAFDLFGNASIGDAQISNFRCGTFAAAPSEPVGGGGGLSVLDRIAALEADQLAESGKVQTFRIQYTPSAGDLTNESANIPVTLPEAFADGNYSIATTIGLSPQVQPWPGAGIVVADGLLCLDSNGNLEVVTTPGTTDADEPDWQEMDGGTTSDGADVVWTLTSMLDTVIVGGYIAKLGTGFTLQVSLEAIFAVPIVIDVTVVHD